MAEHTITDLGNLIWVCASVLWGTLVAIVLTLTQIRDELRRK